MNNSNQESESIESLGIEFIPKEAEWWKLKAELSENIVKRLESDMIDIPKLMEFHRKVAEMCHSEEEKLKL